MVERGYEDSYGRFKPGTGPGAVEGAYVPPAAQQFARPLERNVQVGPLVVSACRCPQCGTVYAHFVNGEQNGWYAATLADDEPDPPCLRCELELGVPLDPAEIHAMQQLRWRFDQYKDAMEVGAMKSQAQMREAFLMFNSSAQIHAPVLLTALERRYGNQQDAGVQQILNEGV